MIARRLIHEDTGAEFGWSCGKCGSTWGNSACGGAKRAAFRVADECCAPKLCECGAECPKRWTSCDACRARHEREREDGLFRSATKVPLSEYTGEFVYFGDDTYLHVDDTDEWEDRANVTDGIRYAWACEPYTGPYLDATNILEGALDEHHEDAIEDVDVDALQALLDEWLKTNAVTSYEPTYKVAVVWDAAPDPAPTVAPKETE